MAAAILHDHPVAARRADALDQRRRDDHDLRLGDVGGALARLVDDVVELDAQLLALLEGFEREVSGGRVRRERL